MSDTAQHVLFLFPGQGSQYRGMGSDLHAEYEVARKVYSEASEVLGYDLAELAFNDPDDQLNLTRFTQPAILTHSIACLEVFRELTDDRLKPGMAAGHSLGEYSALVAAGALGFADAVRLVQQRGELMGTHGEGEMTAFPIDLDTIRPLAERHFCAVAGCNLPDQTVVGGRSSDLEALENAVSEAFPRKRPARLKTEGAFHTYYMVEAARRYREVLDSASFELSSVRVLSNFTGGFHDPDPVAIRSRLFFQLFHPVMWHANLQSALAEGVGTMVEFGGGIGKGETPEEKRPNLEGMVKKTLRGTDFEVTYHAAINASSLAETAGAVNA
ncbi:MAG: acyltransferase domain-containing protein [Gammaproteobacteria bacterium]|jgi:[acyl-carrier-protein] S-malonyltransferase|nr:acyltransferase domain-containing protein [Gammaproteobacteria bacterium]